MRRGPGARDERGAAAVEFALVSMLLITLLLGIIEFAYAFFVQGTIAGSAREGARVYAITSDFSAAQGAAVDAGSAVHVTTTMVILTKGCPPTPTVGTSESATVRIEYPYAGLTGLFPGFPLTGEGAMRCNG